MFTKKDRRHDGWIYPRCTLVGSRQEIVDDCLEPQPYWDDWAEYRDGFRDGFGDYSKIKRARSFYARHDLYCDCRWCVVRIRMNKKLEKLLKRRRIRKMGMKMHEFLEVSFLGGRQ